MHLARSNNTVKKFTFAITNNFGYNHYTLPRSIFLLRHLTDLHIENCTLKLVPTFDGFGSLKSLSFSSVRISEKVLLRLLANCPKLQLLCLALKLEGTSNCINIIKLFKCLPVIKDLSICQSIMKDSYVPPKLSTALAHLRCFWLYLDDYGLEFLFLVIRGSPNLKTLGLYICNHDYFDLEMSEDSEIKSDALSDIWMEHLKEFEIRGFANLQHEMEFVKLIVAKGPVLMRVRIFMCESVQKDEELEIERTILAFPRVSPFAEIIVKNYR